MDIILIGLNHKTAPIEIRERFYLQPLERELILSEFKNNPNVIEAFILSTCNRTEIYSLLLDDNPQLLLEMLLKTKKVAFTPELNKHFYIKKNNDAIHHLFEVTCGLDSLVVGEKQILGQVKDATDLARRVGIIGKTFNILTNIAICAGKTAQSKTQISSGGSSISWAAVTTAQRLLGTLAEKSILIFGAGKMAYLTAQHLSKKGVNKIFVMNRSPEKAEILAKQMGGIPVGYWQMREVLSQVDVCICSVGAPHYLVERSLVEEAMKAKKQPMVFIDISMPRNINPNVSEIDGVSLISIDELDKVVESSTAVRFSAVSQVQNIIDEKINHFNKKIEKVKILEKGFPVGELILNKKTA